jgi:hypothetical protein
MKIKKAKSRERKRKKGGLYIAQYTASLLGTP